ncbi:hypothetical protein N9055_01515 [Akkermansiaceae bacterium]|nr:hypothetical protein [Akkermansiaceae bacterium]
MPRIKISHRIEYGVYRAFETALCCLSVRSTVSLGEFLGRIAIRILPKYRSIVLRNLRFAYSEAKSPEEIEDLLHEVFERNGGNLLASIRLPLLSDDEILKHVTFENAELIEKKHALGKGTIIIAPHMGNWELLAQALPLLKPEALAGAFYRKLNNPLMDQLIERRRAHRGTHLFAKHSSSHKLTAFLRKNAGLGILGDQRMPKRGDPVVFFGRPTTFSPLPELLARRTDSALMGMHCRSSGPGQWIVSLTEIKDASAQSCADSLEKAWRSSPADVFWFQDRWRLTGKKPLSFLETLDPAHPVTKPLRIASTSMISLPKNLATVEVIDLNMDAPTDELAAQLHQLSDAGKYPVDLYCCAQTFIPTLKKAAGRIPVASPEDFS